MHLYEDRSAFPAGSLKIPDLPGALVRHVTLQALSKRLLRVRVFPSHAERKPGKARCLNDGNSGLVVWRQRIMTMVIKV